MRSIYQMTNLISLRKWWTSFIQQSTTIIELLVTGLPKRSWTQTMTADEAAVEAAVELAVEPVNEVVMVADLEDPSPSEGSVEYAKQDNLTEDSAISIWEYNPLSLVTNVKVYIIADKNAIEALKTLASKKYQRVVRKSWNHPAFAESARLVYENTMESDRAIRDVIVQTASENIKALLDRGEFIELLNTYGELATEILKKLVASDKPIDGSHENFAEQPGWEYSKEKKKKAWY
jgi:hypothetical protein